MRQGFEAEGPEEAEGKVVGRRGGRLTGELRRRGQAGRSSAEMVARGGGANSQAAIFGGFQRGLAPFGLPTTVRLCSRLTLTYFSFFDIVSLR